MTPGDIRKKRSTNSGMTLVEVMVATGVLLLGLSTFLAAFSGIGRVSVAANRRMQALHRAREVLELVMGQPYSSSALNVGTHALSDAAYTVSLDTGFKTTKDVAVTVAWLDPRGNEPRDLTLQGSMALCMH
jgi:type II secretory pathway pseudopilin PulG